MGTTTATLYLKPRASAYLTINFQTQASVYVPVRALSGTYTGSGITALRNLRGLKSYLPSQNVPVDTAGNKMAAEWYTFFHYFCNVFTDLESAVTLADIKQALIVEQAQAAYTAALALASSQQVVANAQTLAAVVQVTQTAALAGATQIPPVQLVPAEPAWTNEPAGGAGSE
jgi:hypothetical protein